jgi:O-antigen biosynthesis protein
MKINFYPMDIYGCGFYRMLQPAKALKEICNTDVYVSFLINEKDQTAPEFDIAVLQRPSLEGVLPAVFNMLNKGVKILFDVDDWIFEIPEWSPAAEHYNHEVVRQNFKVMFEFAHGIITTNYYLAKKLLMFNKNIIQFPNYLDFDIWDGFLKNKLNNKKNPDEIIIGWHGSETHEKDILLQADSIIRILKEFENVKFKCVGWDIRKIEVFESVKHKIIYQRGTYPTKFGNLLRDFDIGIAPLLDCEFNRCKSPIKYLEYSALKIPCVASPVRPYSDEIGTDYTRGVLSDEFYFDLKHLVQSKNLRKAIGNYAYDYVKENYNINNHILEFKNMLENVKK